MKPGKFVVMISAVALAFALVPNVGWSTRAYGPMITGEVTAAPSNGTIEIAHHLYHIKANSAADKVLNSIHAGQNVDIILDGPQSSSASEVVAITQHAGT